MKKFWTYFGLGLASFLFFFYWLFPRVALKEALSLRLSEAMDVSVDVGEMGLIFPLGLSLKQVRVTDRQGHEAKLRHLEGHVSFWHLFSGDIYVYASVEDPQGGSGELGGGIPIWGWDGFPKKVFFSFKGLEITDVLTLMIHRLAKDSSPLLRPLLEKMEVKWKWNVEGILNLSSDPSRSEGKVQWDFPDSGLYFDETMMLPSQIFEKAHGSAAMKEGVLRLGENVLKSKDLELVVAGAFYQKSSLETSALDLDISVELAEELKENFGFLMDAFARKETNGKISLKINGLIGPGPSISLNE